MPGGFTHVFKRRGYEWDVGVHYIGDVHRPGTMLNKMFHYICDTPINWVDMGPVYDKMIFGDKVYDYRKGKQAWMDQMKEYFPEESEAIDKYMQLILDTQRDQRTFFMERALPGAVSAIIGNSLRKKALKRNTTTLEVLQEITSNKKLIAVLCGQFGDYGSPPAESSWLMHAMLFKHYINGGFYPEGGSSVIFDSIAPTVLNQGGQIFNNAEVDQIIIEKNKAVGVKMADGNEYRAPLVVSSAGVFNTYEKMLPKESVQKHKLENNLKKVRPSIGHVCLYVGFNKSEEELKMQKANYWIYPDNYDHDENITNYLKDPDSDIPVAYVSFPSAKDPDWKNRYPGKSAVDIITLADWSWYKEWDGTRWMKRGDDYKAAKEKLSQRLLEILFKYEPQLRDALDYYELGTPLSTKHFVNYSYGELYGLENTPDRFEQKFLRPKTPIKNLYLTGQDVVSCGVGGALASGLLTASAMTGKNLMKRL